MERSHEISQELIEISPLLADLQPVSPFGVPGGYFDALPETIMQKIRFEALLATASANTFSVPAGYFDELPALILSKIKNNTNEISAELETAAPLLNTISRKTPYVVPAGYFEQSNFRAPKKEAKIFSIRVARKWTQFAAAAVFAGLLVTGAFVFTDNRSYLDTEKSERVDVSSELNKVSEAELVKYIDNPEHAVAVNIPSVKEEGLMDVKNNIRQVSDEELDQYLKENGEPLDMVSEKNN
jgi:hypothetical protein